eukprot:TRINITY_DN66860_c0_g1_i1.p1 TRINITY_DN66860_c0_g1~~TRINITY_DN66860_c0_g1_i1.p1  ORF type:complete len:304 (-),score=23.75 TRINITY_DN66860_c0_g1_i1:29-919(-)
MLMLNATHAQTVTISEMENWRTPSVFGTQLDAVDGWRCPDSLAHYYTIITQTPSRQLYKSTDKHGGSYAARVVTQNQGPSLGNIAGVLTNAVINVDIVNMKFTLSGGTSLNGRVNFVNAWLKYNPTGGDSATVVVSSIIKGGKPNGDDSVVGAGVQYITAAQPYTLVSVPIDYGTNTASPNALQIVFTSSGRQATVGSELFIDDVSYSIFPAGVSAVNNSNKFDVYPNPASNKLQLASNTALHFTMYNVTGQQVLSADVNGTATIDVAQLAAGTYYYTATNAVGEVVKRSSIVIAK